MGFRHKLLAYFLGLLAAVLGAVLWTATRLETRGAESEVLSSIETARQVLSELLADRGRELAMDLKLLSGDFALKAAVATGDPRTILSAARNHQARIGADVLIVTDTRGKVLADTRRGSRPGRSRASLAVVREALDGRPAEGVQVLDGVPYQLAAEPVSAPDPIGTLAAGFRIDDRLAFSLKRLTRTDVVFASAGRGFASTLEGPAREGLSPLLPGLGSDAPQVAALAGQRYLVVARKLAPEVTVLIMRSWDKALEPAAQLRRSLLAIGAAALVLTILLGFLIAARVTASLAQLVSATRRIAEGDYAIALDIRSQDEIGALGRAFAEMAKGLSDKTAKLKETTALLIQAQKMEAVGRLAGGVAHDFNNVLSAISGFSDLLLMSMKADDPHRPDVQEIQNAGRRAAALTRQLLAFSRKQELEPQTFELNGLVGEIQKMLKRLIGADIELTFAAGADAGKVRADRGQLEQVLMNLVVNARDAMPSGGRLTVATSSCVLDEEALRAVPGSKAGPYAVIEVADTGCGMDAYTLTRIFEPFFTTKEVGKGTGLGLATVYGIVKQSEGFLKVDSRVGVGTSFKVYLPSAQGEAEARGGVEAQGRGGSETILIVDDEEAVRKPLVRLLGQDGYKVLEASEPEGALRLAEGHPGEIHLLLTDDVMPQMRGHELAKRLKAARPQTRVIFMTGYIDENAPGFNERPKDAAFLQKPIDYDALARRVREALDKPSA